MKPVLAVLCMVAVAFAALPTNFDARSHWTKCSFFILNQQSCGSCWDFCSMESFADRLCITGEATSGTIISPEPILECSSQGCDGGWPSTAWNYAIDKGSTTCTSQCFSGCAPYDSGDGTSPKCHHGTCDSGKNWPVTYYGGSFQSLSGIRDRNLTLYQNELYHYGSLQACFTVYNNFYTYFSTHPKGIYTSASGGSVGGHCVKMIGWGTDNGQDYWLFANSWDTTWADGGYFKMARGDNLCGIEGSVSEGFTKGQTVSLGLAPGVHENVKETEMFVGGWHKQENLEEEFLVKAAHAGLHAVSQKLHRDLRFKKLTFAETQVVAGVNFHMEVATEEGPLVRMRVFRDLHFSFHLVKHELAF